MRQYASDPDYADCPGETLKEHLESFHAAHADLARQTGLSLQAANGVIAGIAPSRPSWPAVWRQRSIAPHRFG